MQLEQALSGGKSKWGRHSCRPHSYRLPRRHLAPEGSAGPALAPASGPVRRFGSGPGDRSLPTWRFRNRSDFLALRLVRDCPRTSLPHPHRSVSRFGNGRPSRSLRFATTLARRRRKGVFSKSAGPCRRIVTLWSFPCPSIPFGLSGAGQFPVSTIGRCAQTVSRTRAIVGRLSTF